jgi:hypothetical protein
MKDYKDGKVPFDGCNNDALAYWEGRTMDIASHPLKELAIIILQIVPHAADVECLFSDLSGIQGVKQNNLDVDNFEALGKLRCHYWSYLREKGLLKKRKHAHMHTQDEPGINTATVNSLIEVEVQEVPAPGTAGDTEKSPTRGRDFILHQPTEDPEIPTVADVEEEFERLAAESGDDSIDISTGTSITAFPAYKLSELERVDKGLAPTPLIDEIYLAPSVGNGSQKVTYTLDSLKRKL